MLFYTINVSLHKKRNNMKKGILALLIFGASTRAAIMLKKALSAWAIVEGRDYANEDDLKFIAPYVLKHRLKFAPGIDSNRPEVFGEFLKPSIEKLVRAAFN